ncbi:MAG: DeoR/GlpR family DNA-binding transcription regulator [Lachnospiraceae bacterium]|nr:DeoR/GlpR family DNA-binding transcription regulator [Lachnospiraceae bacterium]
MKNNRKAVEERQNQILNLVLERGGITVEEAANRFGISLMTVRRDLQTLEDQRKLKRTHGGAVPPGKDMAVSADAGDIDFCRAKISEYASRFIADGDVIFINGSRTALDMLHYVREKRVTVYTNNGWALGSNFPESVTIHITGGEVRNNIMIGEYVVRNLLSISADKVFLGCAAVYEDGEFRYDIPTEIGINEAMIGRATGDLYILADHSKVSRRNEFESTYGSCIYERPVILITDEKANAAVVEKLRKSGMKVIQVPLQ